MEITKINNQQPNFQKLLYEKRVNQSVTNILKKRIPQKKLENFIKKLEESPLNITLGFADSFGDRLDAVISGNKFLKFNSVKEADKAFSYISEGRWSNILNITPYKFMKKVLLEVRSKEEICKKSKNT